ncbi:MAG TPA: lysozyme inhibitor LprI family protein [Thermoanaerobaculia bacterium]|nr:lysozyme inhibitor LprI family protein [Thermoanaerobaculia bacterium]
MLLVLLALLECAQYTALTVEVPEGFDARRDAVELAELFANERGDYAAAMHFLCGAGRELSAADRVSMIAHVGRMQRGETKEPLVFCDHVTSGDGLHECALRLQSELAPALQARYESVPKSASLETLRKRADPFIAADAEWETELSRGEPAYPSMAILTRLDREEAFVELLELYSRQRAPAATAADRKAAEKELREVYWGLRDEVSPDVDYQLNLAQHAWVTYRNAWIAYYLDRWRGAAAPRALRLEIETALTKARTDGLKPVLR